MTLAPGTDAPLLMTPGPTRVPDRVLRAGGRPMIHHRSAEFSRELDEMLRLLGPVFGTAQRVLPVHTTGRGAMEAALCNLFSAGDQIAVCCNGKFGEMWAGFAESWGLVVHRVSTDWGADVDVGAIEQFLRDHSAVRAIACAYVDTSTGARTDIRALAVLAQYFGVLSLVDGVSSIGGMPFEFDAWGVDVAITASQKCLMSSPGLAFVAMSERAWEATERARIPRNYWDFSAIRDEVNKPKPETPGTAPVHLVLQVAEALRAIHEEGVHAVFARHSANALRVRRGVEELGLAMQCASLTSYADTVTGISIPAPLDPVTVRAAIRRHGILTAAGLGRFRESAMRIGHMGDIRAADVDRTLNALREAVAAP